jgi:Flp pilus assembly protein TadD
VTPPDPTRTHGPGRPDGPTGSFDPALDAGLAAAFGPDTTPGGWSHPPLLRDDPSDSAPLVQPSSAEMPRGGGDRYQLLGEIARGGMGVILKGRDPDLGRDLAFKVLKAELAGRLAAEQRFVEEAQVGGQLQHPGVVPVYDLGRFADGRPYFAMKLVKGRTLAELLAERAGPSADRGRFLQVFLQVCQTVAYAHSRGVVHRDLKPSNVMVGAFGEVLVMDWGLAKVLPRGGVADELRASCPREPAAPAGEPTVIRTARSGGGSDTQAGSVMGTPAFMSPEQAGGEIDKLDERVDVFGLGAVLCVVLTGEPPYVAATGEAVRLMAVRGELEDASARLDACGTDAELVELCRRCLAPRRDARPRHAGEVAAAVAGYLAGVEQRAQQAELDRAAAEAEAREQRKRRRVQLALAVAVGAMLLGGGAFAWWRTEQARDGRERLGRNAEAVAALLDQAEAALRAGDAAKAAVVLAAAQERAGEGGADHLNDRLAGRRADLAVLRELDAFDNSRWTSAGYKFHSPAAMAERYRAALRGIGADPGENPEAAAGRVSGSAVRDRLVQVLDRLLWVEKSAGVRAALQAADPDPFRDVVRDAVRAGDAATVAGLAGRPEAVDQPPGFVAMLGEDTAIPVDRRRALLEAAVRRRGGNLGLLMTLGGSYPINLRDGADERVRWYQAAVAAAPANAAVHTNLGAALSDRGDRAGAEAEHREAIRLDPTFAPAHNNLGTVLLKGGDLDGAEAEYREAIRLDPKPATALTNLGKVLLKGGDLDGAEAEHREAIRLDPKSATAHANLGHVLWRRGDLDGAIAKCREAIRLNPEDGEAHNSLGIALRDKGKLDEAVREHKKAISLLPENGELHNNLGLALLAKKDLAGAAACFREALRLDPTLADPHNNLAYILLLGGKLDEALVEVREANRLDPKYATAHATRGEILMAKGDLDGAVTALQEATRLDPRDAVLKQILATARMKKAERDSKREFAPPPRPRG